MKKTLYFNLGMCAALLSGSPAGCGSGSTMGMGPQAVLILSPLGETAGQDGQVISMPSGISCSPECAALFTEGSQVTLSAQPQADYQLATWGGACSGTSPTCTVTMTGPQSVSFRFATTIVAPPVLTGVAPAWAAKAGGTQVTLTGSGFQPDSQVTIAGAAAQKVVYVSPTELKVTVGSGSKAGCAAIAVKNPASPTATLDRSLAYLPTVIGYGTAMSTPTPVSTPKALQVGDFDRDGKTDLLVAHNNGGKLQLFKGNGDGTFGTSVSVFTDETLYGLWVGDLDKDGKLDALTISATTNKLFFLRGNGDGTFAVPSAYPTGVSPSSLAIGDLNGDGKLDAVTANDDGNSISVLLGNGDGTFQAKQDAELGFGISAVALADLDGDTKLDVLTASKVVPVANSNFYVLLGNGDGTLKTAVSYNSGGFFTAVAAGDLDGDSYPEIAGVDSFGTLIKLRANAGNGTFPSALSSLAMTSSPQFVGFLDVDFDGKLDVVATSTMDGASYFLNQGGGAFAARVSIKVGGQPEKLIFADVNGDCLPDFLTSNLSSNTLSTILNTSQ